MKCHAGISVAGILGAAAIAACAWTGAQAASQIVLTGTVGQNCTITVTPATGAATLDLATAGAHRVQVGTVTQTCNKKAGYTVAVTSATCAAAPAGAKVTGAAAGETLSYSVESNNPTTGGSTATITGLLAATCTGQNARAVANAKISGENSTLYVNYTGNGTLSADTYQDTLTLTMNVN
jgi:spore coat protein U-like protein